MDGEGDDGYLLMFCAFAVLFCSVDDDWCGTTLFWVAAILLDSQTGLCIRLGKKVH